MQAGTNAVSYPLSFYLRPLSLRLSDRPTNLPWNFKVPLSLKALQAGTKFCSYACRFNFMEGCCHTRQLCWTTQLASSRASSAVSASEGFGVSHMTCGIGLRGPSSRQVLLLPAPGQDYLGQARAQDRAAIVVKMAIMSFPRIPDFCSQRLDCIHWKWHAGEPRSIKSCASAKSSCAKSSRCFPTEESISLVMRFRVQSSSDHSASSPAQ